MEEKKNIINSGSPDKDELLAFISHNGSMSISGYHNTSKGTTVFTGTSQNNAIFEFLNGSMEQKVYNLLIRAINNRTIERNYFRLYSDFLDGTITEEEFDREIDTHEDEYVIQNDIVPSKEDAMLALALSEKVKDVYSSEDLSSLFSFNSVLLDKLLTNK